jgi:hypothetical protein
MLPQVVTYLPCHTATMHGVAEIAAAEPRNERRLAQGSSRHAWIVHWTSDSWTAHLHGTVQPLSEFAF